MVENVTIAHRDGELPGGGRVLRNEGCKEYMLWTLVVQGHQETGDGRKTQNDHQLQGWFTVNGVATVRPGGP